MKNTIFLQREFGEVTLRAALPSLEDFAQKMSRNQTHNIMEHIPGGRARHMYCPDLTHVYSFDDFDTIFSDFNDVIDQKKLFLLRYNWGDMFLCTEEHLNVVPFFSRGIGVEKTLKFQGIYSESALKKAIETMRELITFVKGFRKNLIFSFEIDEEQDNKVLEVKI
jgi:hypothetical protein